MNKDTLLGLHVASRRLFIYVLVFILGIFLGQNKPSDFLFQAGGIALVICAIVYFITLFAIQSIIKNK